MFALSRYCLHMYHQTVALMVLWLNPCFEFLNILRIPLYFLQSSVDPDDFALWNKVFPLSLGKIHENLGPPKLYVYPVLVQYYSQIIVVSTMAKYCS